MLGVHPQVVFELATRYVKKQPNVAVYGRELQDLIEVIEVAVAKSEMKPFDKLFPVFYSMESAPTSGRACVFFIRDKAFTLKFLVDGKEQPSRIIASEHEQRGLKLMLQSLLRQDAPTAADLQNANVTQQTLDAFMAL